MNIMIILKGICIVVGILQIALIGYGVYESIAMKVEVPKECENEKYAEECESYSSTLVIVHFFLHGLQLLFTVYLLKGVFTEKPNLMTAWVFYNLLLNIFSFGYRLYDYITYGIPAPTWLHILHKLVVPWVMWILVLPYYKRLSNQRNRERVKTNPPPVPV